MSAATAMTPRERVRTALDHREPDRIPFDLGGSRMTGIHVSAYPRLREALGLAPVEPRVSDLAQQLADIDTDVMDRLGCDVRVLVPSAGAGYRREMVEADGYTSYVDEWGAARRMPLQGGLYYDTHGAPLAGEPDAATIDGFPWPDGTDPARFVGLADAARHIIETEQRAVMVGSISSGLSEGLFKMRGFEDGYLDLAAEPDRARQVMEKMLEVKLAYWDRALRELGPDVDVIGEADDLGGQDRLLYAPTTYRKLVKPLQAELFSFIHARTKAKIFLHSCGAIREIIPDLIEIGVDILNPVQVSAAHMDSAELKAEFGRDIVFWGGGVDTQRVLGTGTPDQVRADVRRRIGDLRSGGGFIFATVHNVQPNVPVENLMAMWETWREEASYDRS